MKRSIYAFIVLSLIGVVLSLLLLYQHYLPHTELGIFSCGADAVNPCAAIAASGYGDILGFPIAGLGAMAYLCILGAALLALLSGEERYPHLFAALLPLTALMAAAVIPLSLVMARLGVVCRLCAATYVVNLLIGAACFLFYRDVKERMKGLRTLYGELSSIMMKRENRPATVSAAGAFLFLFLFIVTLSAYLGAKGAAAARSDPRVERFREYYYSLPQEELSLPPAAMTTGDQSAEIRIAVFTDFLCTACHRFHNVKKTLLARFPGRIRVDYYNFPLDSVCNRHSSRTVYPNSCVTARAFLAAAEEGAFAGLLDHHFSRYPEIQSRLHRGDSLLGVKDYFDKRIKGGEYARFLQKVMSERTKLELNDEIELGGRLTIDSVPTFFINGRRIVGAPDASLLETVIADELR